MTAKWNALSGVSYRLLLQHTHHHDASTPMFQASNPAHSPMPSPYPDLMIKGHDHLWWINQRDPFYIVSIGGGPEWVKRNCEAALFNFNYENGQWSCPQATPTFGRTRAAVEFIKVENGEKISTLRDRFSYPNDGTATSNTCTIENDTKFHFYDGRQRFVMAPGSYSVTGGEILSQYQSSDGKKTIVLVKVDIPAKGTVTVSINQGIQAPTTEPAQTESPEPTVTPNPTPTVEPTPPETQISTPTPSGAPVPTGEPSDELPTDSQEPKGPDSEGSDKKSADKPYTMDKGLEVFIVLTILSGLSMILYQFKIKLNKKGNRS